ncbi:MAG: hypothetical protein WD336_05355 [Trueperaceae bacterium]
MATDVALPRTRARARLLWVDASAAAVAGALVLAFRGWFERLHALPLEVLLFVRSANVLYAAYASTLARRPGRTLRQIGGLVGANAVWVLVCLALVVRHGEHASVFGIAHLLGEAVFVGTLAVMEWDQRHRLAGTGA